MRRGLRNGLFPLLAATALANSTLTAVAQNAPAPNAPREGRPNPNLNLRVPAMPQAMLDVLDTWETKSAKIHRLEGQHERFEYNKVFEVETRGEGKFYYEAPDKGRIEIKPARLFNAKPRKPNFKVEPAKPEHWVCDGIKVTKINEQDKTYMELAIPPAQRGENIINSQLPFLFGMKAEQAKRRYQFVLMKSNPGQILLAAKPNWPQDAQNFSEAYILLDEERYLPVRVLLKDPSGNIETEYIFSDLKIDHKLNRIQSLLGFGEEDPFNPDLKGFRKVDIEVGAQANGAPPAARPAMPPQPGNQPPAPGNAINVPDFSGMHWKNAQAAAKKFGLDCKIFPGEPAKDKKLIFVVYEQLPVANSKVEMGDVINLRLYDDPARVEE